jgi:membrane-associated protease RseP (regulator of RpoE activity)
MSRLFTAWGVLLCGCLGFGMLLGGSALVAAPVPQKDEPKKDEPKKDEPPDLPFPALPKLVLPPDADPELQRLEEELLKEREMILKQLGQFGRTQPGGLPNLPGLQPGVRVAPAADLRPKENRLGAVVQAPTVALVDQLDLPKDQGVVIEKLKEGSAAGKAGLKDNDILLELDGKSVPSKLDDFTKLLDAIKPDAPVDATVLRKGKRETVKGIKLPEMKAEEQPRPQPNPVLPNLPAQPNPAAVLPPLNLAPGAKNISVQMIRTGDGFTTRFRNGNESIAVSGKMKDGKANADEIVLSDGKDTKKFKSVNDVPEGMREQVKNLIQMTEKGTAPVTEAEK